jgi:hypothetical protein
MAGAQTMNPANPARRLFTLGVLELRPLSLALGLRRDGDVDHSGPLVGKETRQPRRRVLPCARETG